MQPVSAGDGGAFASSSGLAVQALGTLILDSVPAAILVIANSGQIVYCNSEVNHMFAYQTGELLGQPIEKIMSAGIRAHIDDFYKAHAGPAAQFAPGQKAMLKPNPTGNTKQEPSRDHQALRKDGGQFPVEIILRPLAYGDEHYVVASVLDISKRKEAHEQLATVIDSSPYGKLVVDHSGIICLVNHRLFDLFGYSKEQLLGQPIEILLPERYRSGHHGMLQNFFANPSLRAMGEGRDLTGRHISGREIPIEIGLAPLDFAGGKCVLVCITDITRRKRLESDLREANAQLEEFTYVVSHDLKSPMRGIADLTEWIVEDLGTGVVPSVANNLQRIQTRIQRMENLTEDLLQYARAAKRSKDVTTVHVPDVVNSILELLVLPEHAQVHLDFAQTDLITAKTPLETVLRNLISNAIKHHHAPENFQLAISTEAAGSYLCIRVQDNGPGIPVSAQERVFRLFQTLNGSGTGLGGVGLAVAKRLTEAHGGRLEFDNQPGLGGCSFALWWPRFLRSDFDD